MRVVVRGEDRVDAFLAWALRAQLVQIVEGSVVQSMDRAAGSLRAVHYEGYYRTVDLDRISLFLGSLP